MTDQPFSPFTDSMKAELKRQYEQRRSHYELLENLRKAEMITQEDYNQQKNELDENIARIEKIDRVFHILG